MNKDPILPQFRKSPDLWAERFEKLFDAAIHAATENNLPTCQVRLEQCREGIIDLLLTGSGRDS